MACKLVAFLEIFTPAKMETVLSGFGKLSSQSEVIILSSEKIFLSACLGLPISFCLAFMGTYEPDLWDS